MKSVMTLYRTAYTAHILRAAREGFQPLEYRQFLAVCLIAEAGPRQCAR